MLSRALQWGHQQQPRKVRATVAVALAVVVDARVAANLARPSFCMWGSGTTSHVVF